MQSRQASLSSHPQAPSMPAACHDCTLQHAALCQPPADNTHAASLSGSRTGSFHLLSTAPLLHRLDSHAAHKRGPALFSAQESSRTHLRQLRDAPQSSGKLERQLCPQRPPLWVWLGPAIRQHAHRPLLHMLLVMMMMMMTMMMTMVTVRSMRMVKMMVMVSAQRA